MPDYPATPEFPKNYLSDGPEPEVIEPEAPFGSVGNEPAPEDGPLPEVPALIEDSVAFINHHVKTAVNAAIAIGEHLLTRYFNNDLELATSRNPYKIISYKQLCDHPDLMLTRPELSNMIRVTAQERFFRSLEFNTDRLTYTHKKYLTRLPDNETKTSLAGECIEANLSSRDLYNRISEIKNEIAPGRSRPPGYAVSREISRVNQTVDSMAWPDIFGNIETIAGLPDESRTALRQKATQWIKTLEAFQMQCSTLIQHLTRMDNEIS